MFGSFRNSSVPPARGSADGPEYWADVDERHREHRRHVRRLSVACALLVLAAIVVHPALLGFLALLGPLLLLEMWMMRRSRPAAPRG